MNISYSVPKKKEDSDYCHVSSCYLFSGLAKKRVRSFFLCVLTRVAQTSGLRPQASAIPMDWVINRHLLQLNFIGLQYYGAHRF